MPLITKDLNGSGSLLRYVEVYAFILSPQAKKIRSHPFNPWHPFFNPVALVESDPAFPIYSDI